jgi:hypothetical protein
MIPRREPRQEQVRDVDDVSGIGLGGGQSRFGQNRDLAEDD